MNVPQIVSEWDEPNHLVIQLENSLVQARTLVQHFDFVL